MTDAKTTFLTLPQALEIGEQYHRFYRRELADIELIQAVAYAERGLSRTEVAALMLLSIMRDELADEGIEDVASAFEYFDIELAEYIEDSHPVWILLRLPPLPARPVESQPA